MNDLLDAFPGEGFFTKSHLDIIKNFSVDRIAFV